MKMNPGREGRLESPDSRRDDDMGKWPALPPSSPGNSRSHAEGANDHHALQEESQPCFQPHRLRVRHRVLQRHADTTGPKAAVQRRTQSRRAATPQPLDYRRPLPRQLLRDLYIQQYHAIVGKDRHRGVAVRMRAGARKSGRRTIHSLRAEPSRAQQFRSPAF